MNELLTAPALWLVLVILPALLAPLVLVPRVRRPATALAPFAPLPLLALALAAPPESSVSFSWLLLETRLALDELGRVFLLFTALLWILASLYLRGYVHEPRRAQRLCVFFLLTMTGNLGLIVAADLATFYFFFSLMSFSGYGLVIHEGSGEARRAARVYIVFTVVGELLVFTGILLAAFATAGLALRDVPVAIAQSGRVTIICVLLLGGFGVKAGVLLLHMWLPLAHPVAPTPASAVLSGVMIKAGLLGFLRLLPLGVLPLSALGALVMAAGIAAAFYAVLVGVTQHDPKTILAYSSISQMGLATLAVGVALAEPALAPVAVAAAGLFALHHGLAKGALFLGVGIAERTLSRRASLLVAIALVLLTLSISGLPLSSGAIAKKALEELVHEAPGRFGELLPALVSLSSAATLLLLLRFLSCLRAKAGHEDEAPTPSLTLPWAVATTLALASLWVLPWLGAPEHARATIGLEPVWSSLWPALVGLAIYLVAARVARRSARRLPAIPPGDLVVPLERLLRALRTACEHTARVLREHLSLQPLRTLGAHATSGMRRVIAQERHAGWTSGGMLLLALVTLLTVLAVLDAR